MSLKEYLEKNNLKPGSFAKRLGCSDSMVRRIILYNQRPGVDLALAIQKETSGVVRADELLGINAKEAAA